MRIFGSIWIYFLILALHGLLVLVFNTTQLREKLRATLDENLMAWLLRITHTSIWFDALILLMAQSCFELMLCFVIGFDSVKHISPLYMNTFDYISASTNISFMFLIAPFLAYTATMACYTLHHQTKNLPTFVKPDPIDPTSFLPQQRFYMNLDPQRKIA